MDQAKILVIDADAHVIENDHTWDFLEPSEARYRPRTVSDPDESEFRYWQVDGRRGPPALSVEGGDESTGVLGENIELKISPQDVNFLKSLKIKVDDLDAHP